MAGMLAADTELDRRLGRTSGLASDADELADAVLVEFGERVGIEDAE
ncbi:MAG: hypothetical protein R2710_06040 [Acidimicrobiales bacterium]